MTKQQKLIVLRGMPTLSKLHKAKRMFTGRIGVVYGADMYFENEDGSFRFDVKRVAASHEWCYRNVKLALQSGREVVVVNNTFIKQWEIEKYKNLARLMDVQLEIITDQSSRIANPSDEENFRCIPKDTWSRMLNGFED